MDITEDKTLERKRPVPILTRENHEQWFRLMKLYLQREEIWDVIQHPDKQSFAWTKQNANALYTLSISIGTTDQELTESFETVKETWDSLYKKYTTKTPSQGRQYLREFTNYRVPPATRI